MSTSAEIREVVDETLKSMGLDKKLNLETVKGLVELKALVSVARQQLVAMGPKINQEYIPAAKTELTEVIKASDESMMNVLDCANKLDEIESQIPEEIATQLREIVTNIYNASVNHDVMVQRINKVSGILCSIDTDLSQISLDPNKAPPPPPETKKKDPLMEGPQSSEQAPSQDDIDSLFG